MSAVAQAVQWLVAIVIAIPVAVVTGFIAIYLLDAILPPGKDWQLPTMFLSACVAAAVAGVACLRIVKKQFPHPADSKISSDRD